jgi:ABC-type Zn2+ transport system substrate-binding protein/surface adhesin
MWQSGELDQKRLDEINEMDLHAWLREQKAKEVTESIHTALL